MYIEHFKHYRPEGSQSQDSTESTMWSVEHTYSVKVEAIQALVT